MIVILTIRLRIILCIIKTEVCNTDEKKNVMINFKETLNFLERISIRKQ